MEINKIRRAFSDIRIGEGERVIEGYAIVFNQRSRLLFDPNIGKPVIEIIHPEAVTEDLIKRSDVIANIEHDDDRMLARSRNGEGSLELRKDEHGLMFRFVSPVTPDGITAYEGVKRHDFPGCSFCYWNKFNRGVEYEDAGEEIIRHVRSIDYLGDISIVKNPAYEQTEVEARSAGKDLISKELRSAIPQLFEKVNPEPSAEMLRDKEYINSIINR